MRDPEGNRALLAELMELAGSGALSPIDPTPYPLDEVVKALLDLQDRRSPARSCSSPDDPSGVPVGQAREAISAACSSRRGSTTSRGALGMRNTHSVTPMLSKWSSLPGSGIEQKGTVSRVAGSRPAAATTPRRRGSVQEERRGGQE